MTYGYGPPQWSDDDPNASPRRRRRPPPPPPPPPPEPPTSGWTNPPRPVPRIPSPPPPARFGGQPGYSTPASAPPTSPPPTRSRPGPPNNTGSMPTGYPAFPPPVPTSPPVRARERSNEAAPRGGRPAPPATRPPMVPGRPPPPGPRGPQRRAPAPKPPHIPARQRAARIAEAVPGLIRNLPHHKPWMVALSLIAVVVVVATCGLGSYLLMRDGSTVVGTNPLATPTIPKRDITSRKADPQLLTAAVVFPADKIVVDPSIPPYERIGNAQELTDCRVAAASALAKQLTQFGCNQVIRATFRSTEGTYLVTAGVFNVTDTESANQTDEAIRNPEDKSKPQLTGYVSGVPARPLGRGYLTVASSVVGHFVIYTVIARTDAKQFTDADEAHVKVIVYDLLEKHLRDGVLADWAIDRSSGEPSLAPKVTGSGP